jgi:hypothetical protein
MSNAALIGRMQHLLDEYEAGRLTPTALETAIQSHMQGLEKIDLETIRASRHPTYRLTVSHMSVGEEEFIDTEKESSVLSDFRQFLRSLPAE